MTTYVATWYQIAEQMLQIRLFLRDTPMKWDPVTKRPSIRPSVRLLTFHRNVFCYKSRRTIRTEFCMRLQCNEALSAWIHLDPPSLGAWGQFAPKFGIFLIFFRKYWKESTEIDMEGILEYV